LRPSNTDLIWNSSTFLSLTNSFIQSPSDTSSKIVAHLLPNYFVTSSPFSIAFLPLNSSASSHRRFHCFMLIIGARVKFLEIFYTSVDCLVATAKALIVSPMPLSSYFLFHFHLVFLSLFCVTPHIYASTYFLKI